MHKLVNGKRIKVSPEEQSCLEKERKEQAPLLEKNRCIKKRVKGYGPISNQLDKLWHAIDRGIDLKESDFYLDIKKIKDHNPKP